MSNKKEFGVFRLSESQSFLGGKKIFISYPETPDSEFVVDDSSFVPLSEAIKQLDNASPIPEDKIKSFYDFPNGNDDGKEIPINRQLHEFNDISEISTAINEKAENIKNRAKQLVQQISEDQQFNDKLNSVSGNKSE